MRISYIHLLRLFHLIDRKICVSQRKIEPSSSELEKLRSFGKKIIEAREAQGITQLQLATKIGITDRTLRSIEAGEKPEVKHLIVNRIEDALGISFMEVTQDTSDSAKEKKGQNEYVLQLLEKLPPEWREMKINEMKMLVENFERCESR